MRLKMKNVNITGVHQFLGKGITKNNMVIWGLPKKGGLAKNRDESVFEVGGG